MKSTAAVLVLSLAIITTFVLLNAPLVMAQTEKEGDWLDEHTTFWDGKGKISGQIRLRGESFDNFKSLNDTIYNDDDFFLSRIRLGVDLKPHDVVRVYFQVQDSHQFGVKDSTAFREGPAAREDRLDIHQAFIDFAPFRDMPLTFRGGRHELSYGEQRLIGAFGWSNVGRTFDSLKLIYDREQAFMDIWAANVVIPEDRHLNSSSHRDDFFGLYGGWKELPGGVWEGYFLFRDDDRKGDGREIYTFGTRIAGKIPANDAFDYSLELVGQLGDAANGEDQEAFAAHFAAGYTFKKVSYAPRVGLEYNYSSGDDDPNDGKNNTLDNLFPTNHMHYGYMDLFSWRNMHNIRLSASAKPIEKLILKCDFHFFWLADTNDNWYNAGGGIVRPGGVPGADSFVGEELDLSAIYKFNKRLSFMAGYSHFFSGRFVRDTGEDKDADWAFIQTAFSF